MAVHISIHTSVDDLKSSLKCSFNGANVKDFKNAIAREKKHLNRTSVITLLTRAMNYSKMGAHSL